MEKVSDSFPPVSQHVPRLVFFCHGERNDTQTIFSVVDEKSYVTNIPQMCEKLCISHSHGWLIMMDYNNNNNLSLLNPKTNEAIQIPGELPYKDDEEFECFMSSEPTDPNCVVFFTATREPIIKFCHPNDTAWREMRYEIDAEEGLYDFVTCKGKLYALTWMGKIAVVDFNADPVVRLLGLPERPCTRVGGIGSMRNLVESCGEIFSIFAEYLAYTGIIITLNIYKADFSEEKWVDVESIGDRVFFLCEGRSVSCAASESGLRGDIIYYVKPDEDRDPKLYSFDLTDESIGMNLPCPKLTKPWNGPKWIFM